MNISFKYYKIVGPENIFLPGQWKIFLPWWQVQISVSGVPESVTHSNIIRMGTWLQVVILTYQVDRYTHTVITNLFLLELLISKLNSRVGVLGIPGFGVLSN